MKLFLFFALFGIQSLSLAQLLPNGDFEFFEGFGSKAVFREFRDSTSSDYLLNWFCYSQKSLEYFHKSNDSIYTKSGTSFIGVKDSCILFVKLKNRVIYPSRAILSFLSTSDVNFFSNFGLKVWLTDSLITDKSFFSRRPATSFYISGREINKEWVKFSSKFVLTPGSYYIYFYFDNQAQIHTRTSNVYFDNFDITIIEKPEEKLQFISKGIRFQRGKLDLEKSSFLHVDSLIEFLNNHKNKYIGIKVYTDNKGNKDSLLLLSEKQSIALKTLLTDRGISETRIFKTEGLGCENPLNNNKTEDERKRNRRVVIYFIESEKKLD